MSRSKSMEKLACAAAMALAAVGGVARTSQAAVIINEVYPGGGSSNTTTTYQQDFIELYNNGTAAASITGFTLQYASAAGAFPTTTSANSVTFPSFSLPAGGYFLVAGGTNTSAAGAALPTPDATSGIQAGATAGELQLLDSTGAVLDLVGYGSTASAFEGTAPAPSASITTSISRTAGLDTNQNSVDFTAGAPSPTNSGVPEPTSLGLAIGGALMLCRRRR